MNLSLPDGSSIRLQRDAADRVTAVELGEAAIVTCQLDRQSRPVSLHATSLTGESLFSESYAYDVAGNLAHINSGSGGSTMVTYDADDRLVAVHTGQRQMIYGYSPEDDLRSITEGHATSLWNLDNSGRPRIRDLDVVYEWDAGGNLTGLQSVDADIRHEFTAGGLLSRRSVAGMEWQFGYLPSGDRLWKQGPGGRTHYAWLATGLRASGMRRV